MNDTAPVENTPASQPMSETMARWQAQRTGGQMEAYQGSDGQWYLRYAAQVEE